MCKSRVAQHSADAETTTLEGKLSKAREVKQGTDNGVLNISGAAALLCT